MDERTISLQGEDRKILESILKDVNAVLKDSDASEEKEAVQKFLQKVCEELIFVVVGSSGVGKSTFLNKLFHFALFERGEQESTTNIREYHHGVSEAAIQAGKFVTRIFRQSECLEGLQIVDMPGVDCAGDEALAECIRQYLYKSSVLFAVFDAQHVKDHAVWELLETVEAEKVVFVLTKCDLAEPEVIEESECRLRRYMQDAGIQSPVFRVHAAQKEDGQTGEDGLDSIRQYITDEVVGVNPTLTKQQKNVTELEKMLTELSASFERRKQQYQSDACILNNINSSMDAFVLNSRTQIDTLKEDLRREIECAIEAYQDEIVSKLDPLKIKERFPNGSADFTDYLNLINEGYRKRMTDNVNRKTQECVQGYLSDLEGVFEQAVGFFNKRDEILALEDKFYGSMVVSKKSMVAKVSSGIEVTRDYYHGLAGASAELFMELWKARGKHEQLVTNATTAGGVSGTAAGAAAGYMIAHFGLGLSSVGLWPVVGAIIGAVLIADMAKKIASANSLPELEKRAAEAVTEFKAEVDRTKVEMTAQILDTVDEMFCLELENVDRTFVDFRMSVNIDSKNIPVLEEKLNTIHGYMQRIKELERRA